MTRIQSLIMSSSLEVLTSWSGIFAKLTRYSSSQNNEKSQLLLNHCLQEPLIPSVIKVLCPFLCIISSISHRWTWLNVTLPFQAHFWVGTFCYLALQSHCEGVNESRTVFCGPICSFSTVCQLTHCHRNTTRFWRQEGIYAPALNILSVRPGPSCLVGLKARQAGSCRSRPPPPPSFTPKPCKTSRWDSRPTMCPRPMFTSSVEALPFPRPSQYFKAEKESVIRGLAVHCVGQWFIWGCTNSLIVNTPARASQLSRGLSQ